MLDGFREKCGEGHLGTELTMRGQDKGRCHLVGQFVELGEGVLPPLIGNVTWASGNIGLEGFRKSLHTLTPLTT